MPLPKAEQAGRIQADKKHPTAFCRRDFLSVLAVAMLHLPVIEPSLKKDRAAVRKTSRKNEDDKYLSSSFFGLVLSERFSAQTSHLCSAPPLGCGTSRRFERLVWASLHLSERSRTIEVRITTLSPQICTKSLTQSCLALSAQSILTRLTEYELSGKDPLLACLS